MRRLVLVLGLALAVPMPGRARAEPPATHEILANRPSGFWTSNVPAQNGSYRYRLLELGVAIAALTGLLVWRLVKRTNAARAS